jgi:cytidine deaminase
MSSAAEEQNIMDHREALLQQAREAARHAHSVYSHFRVGAALRANDHIFTGVNIEISSYGLTLCAERAALAAAVTAGAGPITHLAVACIDARPEAGAQERVPCGACRQWIADLAPDAIIYIDGIDRNFSIDDLLPYAFGLEGRST